MIYPIHTTVLVLLRVFVGAQATPQSAPAASRESELKKSWTESVTKQRKRTPFGFWALTSWFGRDTAASLRSVDVYISMFLCPPIFRHQTTGRLRAASRAPASLRVRRRSPGDAGRHRRGHAGGAGGARVVTDGARTQGATTVAWTRRHRPDVVAPPAADRGGFGMAEPLP